MAKPDSSFTVLPGEQCARILKEVCALLFLSLGNSPLKEKMLSLPYLSVWFTCFSRDFQSASQAQSHPWICSQAQVAMESTFAGKETRKTKPPPKLLKVSQMLQEANLAIKTKSKIRPRIIHLCVVALIRTN